MRTKEQIEELVVSAFNKLVNASADLSAKVSPREKWQFIQSLRVVFNDLRLKNSINAVTLQQFADEVYAEELRKQEFFEKVRRRINEITKKNYAADSVILKGEDVNSVNFFFDFSKILNPLIKEFKYSADYSLMQKCRTPYQLADMFYRRGRF